MVILSVVACAKVATAAAGVSCALAEEFFVRHNVSADASDEPGAGTSKHDTNETLMAITRDHRENATDVELWQLAKFSTYKINGEK